jgi:hypothetical protein
MLRPLGLLWAVIVRDIEPVFGASTMPYHENSFTNHVSTLSAATDGYQLAIYSNLEFVGAVLPADPVSVRVSHYISVRSSSIDAVLNKAPPSVLNMPAAWPRIQVPALSRRIEPASPGKRSFWISITTQSWRQRHAGY